MWGFGYMGRPIARRLLESGFKLTAYDRDHDKAEDLVRYGGTARRRVLRNCLPAATSCCPAYRAMKRSWTLIEDLTAEPEAVPARRRRPPPPCRWLRPRTTDQTRRDARGGAAPPGSGRERRVTPRLDARWRRRWNCTVRARASLTIPLSPQLWKPGRPPRARL